MVGKENYFPAVNVVPFFVIAFLREDQKGQVNMSQRFLETVEFGGFRIEGLRIENGGCQQFQ